MRSGPDIQGRLGALILIGLCRAESGLMKAVQAFGMGASAAQRANVKYRCAKCDVQRRIVDLGVVGQGCHGGAMIEFECLQGIVWPCVENTDAREPCRIGPGTTWIDDGDIVADSLRQGCQGLSDMDRADDDKTQGWIKDIEKEIASINLDGRRAIMGECFGHGC